MISFIRKVFIYTKSSIQNTWSRYSLEIGLIVIIWAIFSRTLLFLGVRLSPDHRLILIIIFLLIFFFGRKFFLSNFFNLSPIQFYLFCCFRIENFLNQNGWFYAPLLFFSICFYFTFDDPVDMMFCISVYLFFLSPYFGIQRLILNPERCPSFTGLEKSEDLTWDKIFESLSLFSITKYGKAINYRLPLTWKSTSFSYVSKKHMFKKAFQSTYANISADAEVYKVVGIFAGVATSAYSIYSRNVEFQKDYDRKVKYQRESLAIEQQKIDFQEKVHLENMEIQKSALRLEYIKHGADFSISSFLKPTVEAEVLKTPNPSVTVDPQKVAASLSNLRDNLFF